MNKLQWNLYQNSYIFIQENTIENVVRKCRPSCLGLNVLMRIIQIMPDYTWCDFMQTAVQHLHRAAVSPLNGHAITIPTRPDVALLIIM